MNVCVLQYVILIEFKKVWSLPKLYLNLQHFFKTVKQRNAAKCLAQVHKKLLCKGSAKAKPKA